MSLRDAWADRLARWQAGARFRAVATAFPPTRPIARRRAAALFELCAGFVYSQVLLAVVELDLPRRLRAGPMPADVLGRVCAVPAPAMERLLLAAVSVRILARRGTGFGLGPLGAALVDNPGVAAMVRHHRALYDDLRDPVALLRGDGGGALAAAWPYGVGDPAAYSALMEASQAMVAAEVLHAYPIRRHRAVLDVGGGTGAFLRAVAAAAPGARLTLFDLPGVAALVRDAPFTAVGGDFRHDSLPDGADLVTLVRVLHDHDDGPALALLRACRAALPPGGRIMVAEPMAGTRGAVAAGDGYFGVYLFAMGQGRPRTPARIMAMLAEAGFGRARVWQTRMPLIARVITASVMSA